MHAPAPGGWPRASGHPLQPPRRRAAKPRLRARACVAPGQTAGVPEFLRCPPAPVRRVPGAPYLKGYAVRPGPAGGTDDGGAGHFVAAMKSSFRFPSSRRTVFSIIQEDEVYLLARTRPWPNASPGERLIGGPRAARRSGRWSRAGVRRGAAPGAQLRGLGRRRDAFAVGGRGGSR